MGNLPTRRFRTPSFLSNLHDQFFAPLEQQFEEMWREAVGETGLLDGIQSAAGYPKLNCFIDGDFFIVEATVPGAEQKDVQVEVDNGILTITVENQNQTEKKDDRTFFFREIRKSKSVRQVRLPDYLVGEPDALIKNGILTIKWKHERKQEEPPKTKKIEVKS